MKTSLFKIFLIIGVALVAAPGLWADSPQTPPFNKLREMYAFYYLPFNLHFKVGEHIDDVFPVVPDKLGTLNQTVNPDDMKKVEAEWKTIREGWKKNSLFLTTPVELGKKVRISRHLISHKISVTQTAMDNLSLSNKMILRHALAGKSPEVQAEVTQLNFLKSFMDESDKANFNFFIFSPSWCASSLEYRALFEAYFKKYSDPGLTLHSVVIDDPNESIFDSKVFKELFPHPKKYSHEIVPRFLAIEQKDGKSILYEEGEALSALYNRFFKSHQGFLNQRLSGILPEMPKSTDSSSPSRTIATGQKVAE
jgi:hypothetical protein